MSVRPAGPDDLRAVAAIYGPYVERSVVSFETAAPDAAAWRQRYDAVAAHGLPFLVAEAEGAGASRRASEERTEPGSRPSDTAVEGAVVGYAYAGPWKEREAYRHTVENAIYLAPDARGRGIGRILLDALLAACAAAGARQMIAVIADTGDPASVRLHTCCGFREVGRLERVGFKHGRWVDTVLMQRDLSGCGAPG